MRLGYYEVATHAFKIAAATFAFAVALQALSVNHSPMRCRPLVGSPPYPPGSQPTAYVLYDSALRDDRLGDAACARERYAAAESGFRKEIAVTRNRAITVRATSFLIGALAAHGVLLETAHHAGATGKWQEARRLYATVHPVRSALSPGDRLFNRGSYNAAFSAYRNALFPEGQNPFLNPVEVESGAAGRIKRALDQAANGQYADAETTLRVSPTSQLTSYLLGQTLYAGGKRGAARRAYIEALTVTMQSTSPLPAFSYVSYAAIQRLLQ